MVARLSGPKPMTPMALAAEAGVPRTVAKPIEHLRGAPASLLAGRELG